MLNRIETENAIVFTTLLATTLSLFQLFKTLNFYRNSNICPTKPSTKTKQNQRQAKALVKPGPILRLGTLRNISQGGKYMHMIL